MPRKVHQSIASPANPPDLPETLAAAVLRAQEGTFPTPTEEERLQLPNLFEMLTPMLVGDPNHKGKGDPRKVLREPLLLLSWDRMVATWKVALADKVLNISGATPVRSLLTALADAEAALTGGAFPFKTKRVT